MVIWALLVLLAAICRGQVLATWKMIAAKSHQGSGSTAQAIAVKPEINSRDVHPIAETRTLCRARADGIQRPARTVRFDGKEYPCEGLELEDMADTAVATRFNTRTAAVSNRESGRVNPITAIGTGIQTAETGVMNVKFKSGGGYAGR